MMMVIMMRMMSVFVPFCRTTAKGRRQLEEERINIVWFNLGLSWLEIGSVLFDANLMSQRV